MISTYPPYKDKKVLTIGSRIFKVQTAGTLVEPSESMILLNSRTEQKLIVPVFNLIWICRLHGLSICLIFLGCRSLKLLDADNL